MEKKMNYRTAQEAFWAGKFGDDYIGRNDSEKLLASNLNFFSKCFAHIGRPESVIEFGANVGMNLRAINLLFPGVDMFGIEINERAAEELDTYIPTRVFKGSILDYNGPVKYDVALVKGVLIHINPEALLDVYDKLYRASRRYILIAEYYNPAPIAIDYRGHDDKLFKRDFAGDIMERHKDLRLVDYGFAYRRDPAFPQDDITWFLLEKTNTCCTSKGCK